MDSNKEVQEILQKIQVLRREAVEREEKVIRLTESTFDPSDEEKLRKEELALKEDVSSIEEKSSGRSDLLAVPIRIQVEKFKETIKKIEVRLANPLASNLRKKIEKLQTEAQEVRKNIEKIQLPQVGKKLFIVGDSAGFAIQDSADPEKNYEWSHHSGISVKVTDLTVPPISIKIPM